MGEWEIYEANLRPSLGPRSKTLRMNFRASGTHTHTRVHVGVSVLGKEWVGLLQSERGQVTQWDESLLSTLQICPSVLEQLRMFPESSLIPTRGVF